MVYEGLIMSFLGDFFKNYSQVALQSNAAKLNYNYSIKSAKNMPDATRTGLENAGYNPMLAVQNSTSGANSSWTSAGQSQNNDLGNLVSNAQAFKRLENETIQAEANADLANEQAKTEEDKRLNLRFDSMMKDAKKHMIDKETSWIDKEKNAKIYKDMQDAERARAEASVVAYNADTARIAADAQKTNAEVNKEWTPTRIVGGIAAGASAYALSKIPGLKYLKKAKVGF